MPINLINDIFKQEIWTPHIAYFHISLKFMYKMWN